MCSDGLCCSEQRTPYRRSFRRFIVLSVCLDKLVGHGAAFSERNRSLFLRSEPPFRRLEHGFGGDHRNYSTPATLAAIAPKQAASAVFPRPAEVTGGMGRNV